MSTNDVCSSCQAPTKPGALYCVQCGNKLPVAAESKPKVESAAEAYLLRLTQAGLLLAQSPLANLSDFAVLNEKQTSGDFRQGVYIDSANKAVELEISILVAPKQLHEAAAESIQSWTKATEIRVAASAEVLAVVRLRSGSELSVADGYLKKVADLLTLTTAPIKQTPVATVALLVDKLFEADVVNDFVDVAESEDRWAHKLWSEGELSIVVHSSTDPEPKYPDCRVVLVPTLKKNLVPAGIKGVDGQVFEAVTPDRRFTVFFAYGPQHEPFLGEIVSKVMSALK